MWPHTKSFAIGAISSIAALSLSTLALARTNAFVMPGSVPLAAWEWGVVLGLGATLVAFIIQLAAIAAFRAAVWPALAGFIASMTIILLASGLLPSGIKTLISSAIGAALASLLARVMFSNSLKPNPLR